ncbi:MAG: hypothetical protein RXQ96_08610, partial [Thermocladium sp.]
MDGPDRRALIERITPVQHEPIEHTPIQHTPITPIQRAPTGHAPIIKTPIAPPISREPITPIEHIPIASRVVSATPPIQVTRVREPVRAPIIGIQAPTSFINALENISRERLGKPLPIEGGTPIAYLPWGGLTHIQGIIITPRRSILPSNALSELRKEAEKINATQHGIVLAPIKSIHLPSPNAPVEHTPVEHVPIERIPIERIPISREPITPIEHSTITPIEHITPIQHTSTITP